MTSCLHRRLAEKQVSRDLFAQVSIFEIHDTTSILSEVSQLYLQENSQVNFPVQSPRIGGVPRLEAGISFESFDR